MNTINVTNLGELPYSIEEAVNRLRVNIGFLGEDVRKIMVTSTFPNEGKSLVSINLWRQMAESGIRSLYVDLDMRNSVIQQDYPIEAAPGTVLRGTSDFLAGKVPFVDVLCKTQYAKGDFIVNTENIINPSRLLESARFAQMINTYITGYRYVILDTPPLGLVSDGEAIGALCDGAILVVRSGETPTSAVKASIAQLERAGCPLLGVVLSRAESSSYGKYYGSRYGKYYGKYYGEYYGGDSKSK